MSTRFLKMHGLGNDFVILDERTHNYGLTQARIAGLSDRHTGIGCDQFVVLRKPTDPQASVFVHFFNADGSESAACGNASRCVASLVSRESADTSPTLQTLAGLLPTQIGEDGVVSVDMGLPRVQWDQVPLTEPTDTLHLPIDLAPAAVSMGNPHATFFVEDLASVDVRTVGPQVEHAALFPQGANVGFAQVLDAAHIRLRVWERGAGLTLACGSGACAAAVNAARRGLTGRGVFVEMDGGTLFIEWQADGHVWMKGPATVAFQGTVELDDFPQ